MTCIIDVENIESQSHFAWPFDQVPGIGEWIEMSVSSGVTLKGCVADVVWTSQDGQGCATIKVQPLADDNTEQRYVTDLQNLIHAIDVMALERVKNLDVLPAHEWDKFMGGPVAKARATMLYLLDLDDPKTIL